MKSAFTLIELLIVIAILGVLAAAILVAINPGKRNAQARDAIRRGQINAIANALIGYSTIAGRYPSERRCDSSIGSDGTLDCENLVSPPYDWGTSNNDKIYTNLVVNQAFLKKLPIDPINDYIYHYKYEPGINGGTGGNCSTIDPNCFYWVGALLEDPLDPNKPVFRCTDNPLFAEGAGCKEVAGPLTGTTIN